MIALRSLTDHPRVPRRAQLHSWQAGTSTLGYRRANPNAAIRGRAVIGGT